MSKNASYHNPKSRRDSKKKYKRSLESNECKINKSIKENSNNKKFNKRKRMHSYKAENGIQSLMNFTSYRDLGMKIPVKYNIFGFMKRESQKLLYNILTKNFEYITDNIMIYDNASCCSNTHKVLSIINIMSSKRKIKKMNKKYNYPFWLYIDKNKDDYIMFDLYRIFEEYRIKLIFDNKQLINFIELRSHVYDKIDLRKYKFKNSRINRDGTRLEICNLCMPDHSYPIDNIMYIPNITKAQSCVYRFYYKPTVDINDEARINIKNKDSEHLTLLRNKKPESINLIAISNLLRYRDKFKNNRT